MSRRMGIKLRKFGRLCPITGYREESIRVGFPVIVQTDRGVEFGEIVAYERGLPKRIARDVRLKKVLRYATDDDIKTETELNVKEAAAIKVAVDKVRDYEFSIKVVNAEYIFDQSRVIFYYKLEERKRAPNFKELKRDLARMLNTKVDLRQVSPRDEAMMFGGLGPCGRPLCCMAWLDRPKHVTVKMVKDQGLQISPTRTSGLCGRLMCCLEYEYEGKDKKRKEGETR